MSNMYGKHRVVLEKRNARFNQSRNLWYNGRVSLCGSKSGQGGTYNPIGYWYKRDGIFFADLVGSYGARTIDVHDLGGLRTAKELREFVMNYSKERGL